MRRTGIVGALAAVVAVVVAIVLATGGGGEGTYRAAAVFDTAKGIVPGQLVKIAGARVGRVTDVELTPSHKARITFTVKHRFGPFRADASCRILPEGFISENYVECDPGNPARAELAEDAGTPTVPVSHTSVPVELQDVVNLFSLPVDERIRALVNTLGMGLAGRGQDLNALLRRTNPSLTQVRRVLAKVNAQRTALRAAVTDTDTALAAVARRGDDVRGFVRSAAATVATTAAHRRGLAATVQRLPGTLDAIDHGLTAIDDTTKTGTPLLRDLRRAAPGVERAARSVTTFARTARPAVTAVSRATRENQTTLTALGPVAANLRKLATALAPVAGQARVLTESMRDTGAFERTLRLLYSLATVTGSYDGISHIVTIFAGIYPQCFANPQVDGCRHDFRAPNAGTTPVNDPSVASKRPSATQLRGLLNYLLK